MPSDVDDLNCTVLIQMAPRWSSPVAIDNFEHDHKYMAKRVRMVGPTPFILEGDLQIGAVEIKDRNTDLRANVENIGGKGALDVNIVSGQLQTKDVVNQYAQISNVPRLIETTLVTLTVPPGKRYHFKAYTGGGEADGLFRMKINNTVINTMRNSGAMRSVQVSLWGEGCEVPVSAGGTITLTVEHWEKFYGGLFDFEGTILAYSVNA